MDKEDIKVSLSGVFKLVLWRGMDKESRVTTKARIAAHGGGDALRVLSTKRTSMKIKQSWIVGVWLALACPSGAAEPLMRQAFTLLPPEQVEPGVTPANP